MYSFFTNFVIFLELLDFFHEKVCYKLVTRDVINLSHVNLHFALNNIVQE
jgi:hypothetical protein